MDDTPEIKELIKRVRNRRRDGMFVAAYVMVAGLSYVVVTESTFNEYAQGVITLVLGAFLNILIGMYNFEFGTSRGSTAKDSTIAELSKTQHHAGQPVEGETK